VIPRIAKILAVIGAVIGVACLDMSAPNGPAAISALQLPSPSVVVGDVMRDSTGAPAKLSVIAYDADGRKLAYQSPQFFSTDSAGPALVDLAGAVLGNKLGTAHVVGQIGTLQTPVAAIPVTVAPKLIARGATTIDTLRAPLSGDTAQKGKGPVAVTVTGDSGAAAIGFIVKYTLVQAPATKPGSKLPAVYLADDAGRPSTVDTTDASGASRTLTVVTALLADSTLLLPGRVDSAVVTAQTSYKGALVSPSPIRIVVPIVVKLKLP
jgi:hypothetical protein